jgi:hypothetical protein
MKVVKLSVHKNTKLQREAKEFRKSAISNFKKMLNNSNATNYVVVAWSDDGCYFDTSWSLSDNSKLSPAATPELVKVALLDKLIRG